MILCTLVVFGFMNFSFGQASVNVERISVQAYDTNGQVEQFQLKGNEALSFDIPAYITENDHLQRIVINGSIRNALTTTTIKFDSNNEQNEDGNYVCKEETSKLTPFLGVWGTSAGGSKGVDVRRIIPKTAASIAGMTAIDNITEFDGMVINNFPELKKAVLSSKIGERVTLTLANESNQYSKEVVVGSRGLKTINYKYCEEKPIEIVEDRNGSLEEVYLDSYPNPTNALSHINFRSASDEALTFSVTDIAGKLIHKQVITNFDGDLRLDYNLDNQIDGTYIFSIQQGKEIYNRKVQLAK